ncbi:Beta-lactamase precursor [compost metagenome]
MLILPLVSKGQTLPKWYPELKSIVDARTSQNKFVDGAVGVITKQFETPETATFGLANLNTLFEIGSITKSFTGIIFAQLVLEKTVSSEDTVEKYIPELRGTFAGQIQLAALATHSSGLARVPEDIPNTLNPYSHYTWSQLLIYLKDVKPIAESKPYPLQYSNTGFALLGKVLEIASGESYSSLLQKRIFDPINMTDTSLQISFKNRNRLIDGHGADLKVMPHWDWLVFAPTGGIRSTASDMIKFLSANLYIDHSDLGKAIKLSQKNKWGWDSQTLNLPFPYKNGGTYSFSSAMFIDHTRQVAGIILTNTSYEVDSLVVPILKANNHPNMAQEKRITPPPSSF